MLSEYATKQLEGWIKSKSTQQVMLYAGLGFSTLLLFLFLILYGYQKFRFQWHGLYLPRLNWASTFVLIVSCITIYEARLALQNEQFRTYRLGIFATFALGLLFMILQALSILDITTLPLTSTWNTFYLCFFIGFHLFHLLVGLALLGMILTDALRNFTYIDAFIYSINGPNILRFKVTSIFWYYLTGAWFILFSILQSIQWMGPLK